MGCGFAVFLDFIGARIIEQAVWCWPVNGIFFATFAVTFATFAVKIFNRKGRKGSRKVRKGLDPFFITQYVMF